MEKHSYISVDIGNRSFDNVIELCNSGSLYLRGNKKPITCLLDLSNEYQFNDRDICFRSLKTK